MFTELTESNFREWIARILNELRTYERIPGAQTTVARYCEQIGNVCWHFDRNEAQAWFKRAIELRRAANLVPNWISAFLFWKLEDVAALREECKRIVEINERHFGESKRQPLSEDVFKARDQEREILRAVNELATAHFLLEEFEKALEWVTVGAKESHGWSQWDKAWDGGVSSACVYIRDMSKAILEKDSALCEEALKVMRGYLPIWPSDAGGMSEELYRFALSLKEKYFPSGGRNPSQSGVPVPTRNGS